MKKVLIVGGNSGIGLALTLKLLENGADHIYIVGKQLPVETDIPDSAKRVFAEQVTSFVLDLTSEDYSVFDSIQDIDALIITAGFGRVTLFENLSECEIKNLIKCNELATIQILHKYYSKIKSTSDFHTGVMVSIAGHVSSPFMSVYGASKAGLRMFIESANIELKAAGLKNRILDCSPGSLKGTAFNGGKNDVSLLDGFTTDFLKHMWQRDELFIPQYDEIYKGVLERYHENPEDYGLHSYNYKQSSGRVSTKKQVVIGYLSGTFDLFHIGHLNLLRRAKEQCDYLIVGVHESGAWKGKQTFIPFEERLAIVANIKYVDKAVKSFREDAEAWDAYHYNKLFVGSDYKGTERFQRYEKYFADKDVEIVYFPYTQGTSSTQLRKALEAAINKTEK